MIVAITGGIGSGKTTVAKVFETMGCVLYNSDEKAKELYFDLEIKHKVIELFGAEAYLQNGQLNREFISGKVFENKALLEKLNSIIHPAIKLDFENFVNQQLPETIIIKESALIFETGLYKNFEPIILVTAPIEQKIERVVKRNSTTRAEVEKRMNAQWTDQQKLPLAHFVITNSNTDAVIPQVVKVLEEIKSHV